NPLYEYPQTLLNFVQAVQIKTTYYIQNVATSLQTEQIIYFFVISERTIDSLIFMNYNLTIDGIKQKPIPTIEHSILQAVE
ncbi:5878_t:CDS:2, partial [Gigaspora rosea]